MKPAFAILQQNYPWQERLLKKQLFDSIGWSDVLMNPAFADTCAIRMSLTLVSPGVTLPGARMKVNAGAMKGRRIEPGQGKLSNILRRVWGKPEVYKSGDAAKNGIGKRTG